MSDARVAGSGEPGLVSVIIPTYNRAYSLSRALDSVLAQTYRSVEILVADDGSTDATRQMVERYGPSVRCLYQPNAGVSAARNLALRHARGEFIALLDSDDWWREWKLEVQLALLRARPDVGMVWSDMSAVNDRGDLLHEYFLRRMYNAYEHVRIESVCRDSGPVFQLWPEAPADMANRRYYVGDVASHMMLGNLVHTSTVLLRRERLARVGGFDETLKVAGEDYDFHLRTCFAGAVGFIDVAGSVYRVGANDQLNVESNQIHVARNTLATLHKALAREQSRIELPKQVLSSRLARCHAWLGEQELSHGDRRSARSHLWQALCLDPRQPRRIALLLLSLLPYPLYITARGGCAYLSGMLLRGLRLVSRDDHACASRGSKSVM